MVALLALAFHCLNQLSLLTFSLFDLALFVESGSFELLLARYAVKLLLRHGI